MKIFAAKRGRHRSPVVALVDRHGRDLADAVDWACQRRLCRCVWDRDRGLEVFWYGGGDFYGVDLRRLADEFDLGVGPRQGFGRVKSGPVIARIVNEIVRVGWTDGLTVSWDRGLTVSDTSGSAERWGLDLAGLLGWLVEVPDDDRIFSEPFNFLGGDQ